MEKIFGVWGHEDVTGDFFISSTGTEYVFQGDGDDGTQWFRNTSDRSEDYISSEYLIENQSLTVPVDVTIKIKLRSAGFTSLEELRQSLEGTYKLGLNPLPKLRKIFEGLPLVVCFAYYGTGGTFFDATPRSAAFAVYLDDNGHVSTTLFDTYLQGDRWFQVTASGDIDVTIPE